MKGEFLNLNISLPRSIYIFIWCFCGMCILGYYFIGDIFNTENTIPSKFKISTQIFWFLFFVWYAVIYIKSLNTDNS